MKPTMFFSLFALLATFVLPAWAQTRCLNYEPEEVKLRGTIIRQTFPGRPNYESIRHGDEPETYWILRMKQPVCVSASTDWERESHVTNLQLVFKGEENQYKRYRRLLGRRVVVSGSLYHAHTGHHHTKVLLTVGDIKRQ